MPSVACCVLARPTKSMGLYRQMAGRVIRPAPGKTDALILDHAGAVFQHGFVEDPVIWTLDPDTKAETPAHVTRGLTSASTILACSQCSAIRTAGKACPECGFLPKRRGEYLQVIDGDLQRLERDGRQHPNAYTPEQKREFHRMLVASPSSADTRSAALRTGSRIDLVIGRSIGTSRRYRRTPK